VHQTLASHLGTYSQPNKKTTLLTVNWKTFFAIPQFIVLIAKTTHYFREIAFKKSRREFKMNSPGFQAGVYEFSL